MATIVTRAGKGSALTHNEVDANFNNLNNDKIEAAQSVTLTNKTLSTGTAITAGTINGATIGATTPSSGAFTTLSSTGNTTLGDAAADTVTVNGTVQPGVVISGSSSGDALRITQTGAGNALVVEDSANPDATPFVIDASGLVITGYTTTQVIAGATYRYQMNEAAPWAAVRWNAASTGPTALFGKSRSATIGTNSIVSSGDAVGAIAFAGDDGTQFVQAASISAAVDGTPGTNDMPGRLVFSTTADGASSPTERMRITSDGRVGIGISGNTATNLTIGKSITGGTTGVGAILNSSIQSDVTAAAYGYRSSPTTQATAFTLPTLSHFAAFPQAFGAGSAVTTQYGFEATSALTGATNNYGFYSNIASGTGRWNFYANGTADNYFAGQVQLGAGTVSAPALSTTGDTNTGIFFPAADTIAFTEGGVESMRLNSSGNLGLGVTPSAWALSGSTAFQIRNAAVAGFQNRVYLLANAYFNASGNGVYIANDYATQYGQSAGQHIWFTAPSGTAGNTITFTQAMTLDASGRLLVGTSTAITSWGSGAAQQVQATASGANYPGLSAYAFSTAAGAGGMINLGHSRGATVGTMTATQSGDTLGYLIFEGVNSSNALTGGGYISVVQSGAAGASYIPGEIRFYTSDATNGPTGRFTMNSTGAFVLQGGDTTANGIGITFPASQSASTNANTLDDYEEGTWTPTITAASGTYTTVTSSGSYVKVGNSVTVRIRVDIANNGTAATRMNIGGFPFAAANTQSMSGATREDQNTGNGFVASPIGTNSITVNRYDATYGLATGAGFTLCITYITS